MARKSSKSKKKKAPEHFPCGHCGKDFGMNIRYCGTCKLHTHPTFMGEKEKECTFCASGLTVSSAKGDKNDAA